MPALLAAFAIAADMQRKFLRAGNLHLETPLEFAVYGDKYKIDGTSGK